MSELVKVVETKIAGVKDFSKGLSEVLRDVEIAFKNQGFLDDTNWKEEVIKALADKTDDALDVDNEHEISSSFVDPSTSDKKYTTSVDNHTGCKTNDDDMFTDNSNDSFEIPETQAFPTTVHLNDELDSEGYAMPDEAVETNDCSQSQALFDVSVLGEKSQNPQHFEDSDTIDLEMSKLQWDDSTKDNDKDKSPSVTPELCFNFLTKTVPIDDLEIEAQSATVTKAFGEALLSPKQSKERNRSTDLDRIETKTNTPSIRENEIDKSWAVRTVSPSGECVRDEEKEITEIVQQDQLDDDDAETQLFKMPSLPDEVTKTKTTSPSIRENGMVDYSAGRTSSNVEYVQDEEKKETEIDSNEESHDENKENAEMGEADATQLFTKPSLPKSDGASKHKTKNVVTNDGTADSGLDETQPFIKSNADNSDEDGGAYDVATQVFELTKNAERKIKINRLFQSEDEEMDNGNAGEANVGNVPHVDNTATESERSKLRKRNRIIDSSEDEEESNDNLVDDGSVTTSKDDEFNVATQKFEICKPVTPKRKCFIDLQGGDWSQLCDQANSEQSNVVFKSIFDQCKDLQIAPTSDVFVSVVAPTVNQKVVAVVPIRQSSRSRSKVTTAERTEDVVEEETRSSKRQKVRPVPLKFSFPAHSSNATSTPSKSNDLISPNAPSPLSHSHHSIQVNENATVEMAATQPFVKVPATPKEEHKAVTRRQARSTKTELPKASEIKGPLPKLRAAKNQSVSYSPKPAEVKVSSDVNENITAKSSDQSDHSDQSTSVVSSRSRKRKATNDTLSLSNESSKSISPSRSSSRHQFRVMFTMIDPKPYKLALKELNITIVDAGSYDVLITDKTYRTRKFLCALAAGKPIVSVGWLEQLKGKKVMPNPFEFLLNDAEGEKKYKFQLAETLDKVTKNGGIFKNHSILVTPNTSPAPDILQDIIASSGGKYLKTSLIPRKGDTVFCISDEKDKKMLPQLKRKYPALREITIEEFMTGIMSYTI